MNRGRKAEGAKSPSAGYRASKGANAPTDATRQPIGQLMVRSRMITHMQLADALVLQATSGGRIGKILLEQGVLSEANLAAALSEHLGIPLIDLSRSTPPAGVVALLPESVARNAVAVPIGADDHVVTIAVADPTPEVTAALQSAAHLEVRISVARRSDVRRSIDAAYHASAESYPQTEALGGT